MTLSFEQARACVLREVQSLGDSEQVPLTDACGRVIAEDTLADRDYPPFDRSARDGFAVRTAELPGDLRVLGEPLAGDGGARERPGFRATARSDLADW